MRLLSGWLGICFTVTGILSVIFYSDISPEAHILSIPGYVALVIVGIILMYIGRGYLLAWLGFISSGNNE